MKEKVFNAKSKVLGAVGVISGVATTALTNVQCYAAEAGAGGVADSMGAILDGAKGDILSVLGVAGAAAGGIFAVKMAWKLGFSFFKSVTR